MIFPLTGYKIDEYVLIIVFTFFFFRMDALIIVNL